MRRASIVAALGAAAALGCTPPPVASRAESGVIEGQRGALRTTDFGISTTLPAPRDSAFVALAWAYTDLGIPADAIDSVQRAVARKETLFPRIFQGELASRLFFCGDRPTGGSHADNGRVYAIVRSQVLADSGRSILQTLVQARVVPDGGTSNGALHCSSTGEIERLIAERTASRLHPR